MRIAAIGVAVVEVPRLPAFGGAAKTALGAAPVSEHAIVLVETDLGITGLGEIASVFARRGRLYAREVESVLAPALLGEDPRRIGFLARRMDLALDGAEPAKAGIEMALFDIVGKAAGVPVYQLLGGRMRERIPLSYSVPWGQPDEMAAFAVERVRWGHRTIKVKVGQDPKDDVAAVLAVRRAIGPEVRLRVDANMAWGSAKQAIGLIERMLQAELELVEQPVGRGELDAMAEIRAAVPVPLMADESVWTPSDAAEVIRRRAADIVNVYVSEAGGLLAAQRIFHLCEGAGLPCMIGAMPELGIGTAAQIHLGLAMANLGPDSDTCGSLYHQQDLLAEPLRLEAGFAYAPDGPGLGVALDMMALERWRVA
jgi:muconate cycloisomerase